MDTSIYSVGVVDGSAPNALDLVPHRMVEYARASPEWDEYTLATVSGARATLTSSGDDVAGFVELFSGDYFHLFSRALTPVGVPTEPGGAFLREDIATQLDLDVGSVFTIDNRQFVVSGLVSRSFNGIIDTTDQVIAWIPFNSFHDHRHPQERAALYGINMARMVVGAPTTVSRSNVYALLELTVERSLANNLLTRSSPIITLSAGAHFQPERYKRLRTLAAAQLSISVIAYVVVVAVSVFAHLMFLYSSHIPLLQICAALGANITALRNVSVQAVLALYMPGCILGSAISGLLYKTLLINTPLDIPSRFLNEQTMWLGLTSLFLGFGIIGFVILVTFLTVPHLAITRRPLMWAIGNARGVPVKVASTTITCMVAVLVTIAFWYLNDIEVNLANHRVLYPESTVVVKISYDEDGNVGHSTFIPEDFGTHLRNTDIGRRIGITTHAPFHSGLWRDEIQIARIGESLIMRGGVVFADDMAAAMIIEPFMRSAAVPTLPIINNVLRDSLDVNIEHYEVTLPNLGIRMPGSNWAGFNTFSTPLHQSEPTVILQLNQAFQFFDYYILIDSDLHPDVLGQRISNELTQYDRGFRVHSSYDANSVVHALFSREYYVRTLAILAMAAAAVAAIVGVSATVVSDIAGRRREIFIRYALGATQLQLLFYMAMRHIPAQALGVALVAPVVVYISVLFGSDFGFESDFQAARSSLLVSFTIVLLCMVTGVICGWLSWWRHRPRSEFTLNAHGERPDNA